VVFSPPEGGPIGIGGATPELVDEHESWPAEMAQDVRSLAHHACKRRAMCLKRIRSSNAREDTL
jgi:hypothetical protein